MSERQNLCVFKPAVLKNIYVPSLELNGKILELVGTENYLGSFDDDCMNNEIAMR